MPSQTTGELLAAEKCGVAKVGPVGEDVTFVFPQCITIHVPALRTELVGLKRNSHVPSQNEKLLLMHLRLMEE